MRPLAGPMLATLQAALDALGYRPVRSFTWATKPAATAVRAGTVIRVSDVGISPGLRLVSDGTNWRIDGRQVLARSAVASAVTGTLSPTTLQSVTIPGGLLGANGSIVVVVHWGMTNNANAKSGRLVFGSTTMVTQTLGTSVVATSAQWTLRNRNSASSQFMLVGANGGGGGSTSTASTVSSENTDNALTLAIQGLLGNTSDTITVESFSVEVLP